MRLPVVPLIGVGLLIAISRGDSPTERLICGENTYDVEPPMFAQTVEDEAHFRCASGFELVGKKIVTCATTSWDHEFPSCRELPHRTLKMKCPYNHGAWSLENLDNIASWIALNEDNVLILDRKFIDNTVDSQRLASAMIERMNDPFFRFFGKMATDDKASLDSVEVIQRFKNSAEFRQLAKEMHEEDPQLYEDMLLDRDDDDEVLRRFYGLHYQDVLADRILPYADSVRAIAKSRPALRKLDQDQVKIAIEPAPAKVDELTNQEDHVSQRDGTDTLDTVVANDILQDILYNQENGRADLTNEDPVQNSYESQEDAGKQRQDDRTSRKRKRERGETERLLPLRSRHKDYFDRDLNQVLDGTKAELQEANLRSSYLSHLVTVIKHIIKYNIPKQKWPEFLQRFELQELIAFLEREGERIEIPPEPVLTCPRPWDIGFQMIHHGRPFLDRSGQRLTIECDDGFVLRGPSEMYCENGKWMTRENRMPTCEDVRGHICDLAALSFIRNSRPALRPGMPRGRILIECNAGFTLRGNGELFCDRGRWAPISGQMPFCDVDHGHIDICMSRPPASPVHGTVTEPHHLTDQDQTVVVRFMCNDGFGLQGMDYSKCDSGTWSPLAPVCVANGTNEIPHNIEMPQTPSRCPLMKIVGGRVHYYEESMPNYARLTCAPGYRLNGQARFMCRDGRWQHPLPNCIDIDNDIDSRISCEHVRPPMNGEVEYITNTAVRFRCRPGYRLVGRNQTTCYRGRWQDEAPRCVLEMSGLCPHVPVVGWNAVVFSYSDGRWFDCLEGFELSGSKVQSCRDGRWDPEPLCVAPPGSTWLNSSASLIFPTLQCPLPPRGGDITVIPRGDKAYYRCRPGEQLVGREVIECVEGRWSESVAPRCLRPVTPRVPTMPPTRRPTVSPIGRCVPQRIRGGNAYLYSEGRIIYYQCQADYFIRGATTLRCENSRWSAALPQCVPIEGQNWPMVEGEIIHEGERCQPPIIVSNSYMTISERGRRVSYMCQSPQGGIEVYRFCHPDTHKWVGSVPDCGVKGVCEPQEIENGRFYQYRDDIGYIQCNHDFVLENSPDGQRNQQAYCRQNTGVWEFGLTPPRCVPDQRPDNRPDPEFIPSRVGEPNNTRFQIDECSPPQVSSNYTWYIQGEGKKITLGCKGRISKRSVGTLTCDGGRWLHDVVPSACKGQEVAPACSMEGRTIENGGYFVYDENHYVFQCNKGFQLDGAAMAVCPGYRPLYPKVIPTLSRIFVLPQCVETTNDSRVDFEESIVDSLDPHFEGRQCHWPKQLANTAPSEYLIMEGGRLVAFRCSGSETSVRCVDDKWVGGDLACLERQHQQRGCDERLPNEPLHGTYFQYQDSRSATRMFYFQCNTGYSLRGPAVVPCDSSTPREPDCVPDPDQFSSRLMKIGNPQPFTVVSCQVPPARIDSGHIVIHESGERVKVHCRPGYLIEGHFTSEVNIICNRQNDLWTTNWPRCVRSGERTPTTPEYDPFGRPLPQNLIGEKAARQNQLLREQFLDHVKQMIEYRQRTAQSMRNQGIHPSLMVPPSLPILPVTPELMQTLEATYGDTYNQGRQTLSSNFEIRQRGRRKIHPNVENMPTPSVTIPSALKPFEKDIVENKLSQSDVDTLRLMPDTKLILQFIEERRKGIHKSKDDPIQSQKFLSQVLGAKTNSRPPVDNVIEQLKQHAEPLPSPHAFKGHPPAAAAPDNGTASENVPKPAESSASSTAASTEAVSITTEIDLLETTTPRPSTEASTGKDTNEQSNPAQQPDGDFVENDAGGVVENNDIDAMELSVADGENNDLGTAGDINSTGLSEGIPEDNADTEQTAESVKVQNSSQAKSGKKPKKGYDTSCALLNNKAPEIENGFVLSYELIEGVESQTLRVTYRCHPEYKFKYEHTSALLCRLGQWKGELPECILDEDEEQEEEEEMEEME